MTEGGTEENSEREIEMGQPSAAEAKVHSTLLALLGRGCIPWRPGWRTKAVGQRHLNLLSGHPYEGADPLLLELAMVKGSKPLPWWCTYVEAREWGLTPRRGAEGVHLGLAQSQARRKQRPKVVFNVADLVGTSLQRILAKRRQSVWANRPSHQQRLQRAEQVLGAWPVRVREGGHLPCYRPREDEILLPMRSNFHCGEAFLATWALQQLRSTRHPQRLARGDGTSVTESEVGREAYVLELAWILLADRLGLGREYGLFVLAEADWIRRLQPTPQVFIELLSEACRTTDLLAAASQTVKATADKQQPLV